MGVLLLSSCETRPRRLMLIGLDALNWSSLNELRDRGELPALSGLIRSGVAGSLATFVPTASPSIWTTMATGRSPDVHGIAFRLMRLDEGGADEMLAALSSDRRRVPALWNLCTERGVPTAFLGWWATWPAEDVLGFMVSDKVRESGMKRTTFPADLRGTLERAGMFDGTLPREQQRRIEAVEAEFKAWRRAIEEGSLAYRGPERDLPRYLDDLAERLRVYRRIMAMDYSTERMTYYLMDRDPSLRVIAPYFWYMDVCQHLLWKYWRPGDFSIDPEEQRIFAPLVPDYYRFIDGVVERLCRHGRPADIVIVSDHGMESSTSDRCINDLFDVEGLLEDLGWLERKEDGSPDFSRSRAYVRSESRQLRLINASVRTREPGGMVSPHALESTITELAGVLAALRAEPSGEPVFKDVRLLGKDEQSYHAGEFIVYAFDQADLAVAINIHAPLSDSLVIGGSRYALDRWSPWHPVASGQHTEGPPGVVLLSGKPFRRGVWISGVRVHDIAPTVLAMLGLPVAQDLEGHVLSEAFRPAFLQRCPVTTVPSYGLRVQPAPAGDAERTGDSALLQQLRALGYIR